MNICERIRLIRSKLELSQSEASSKFNIPLGSWKKYETGPSEPGSGALRGLAEGSVNINWLLTGEGEMLLSDQFKETDAVTRNAIDTSMFVRILERLSEEDFMGRGLGSSMFGYLAALVYSRVMSKSEEKRAAALETSVKELNLILIDKSTSDWEMGILQARQQHQPPDTIEFLNKMVDDNYKLLGSARGKFADRILGPGRQLEAEFLKGFGLVADSPD